MKTLIILVAVLGVATVLNACERSDGSSEVARTIAGQVTDYSGPAGVLEARDERNRVRVGTGTIDAAGRFRLELEDLSERSGAPLIPRECPDLRVSDADAKGFTVTSIDVVAGGASVGTLEQSSVSGDANNSIATYVVRTYADRNVGIEGSCAPLSVDGESVTAYDLDYAQGWNVSVLEIEVSSDISAIFAEEVTVSAAVAKDVGWLYAPNSN